jgi:hypothetical protein
MRKLKSTIETTEAKKTENSNSGSRKQLFIKVNNEIKDFTEKGRMGNRNFLFKYVNQINKVDFKDITKLLSNEF